MGVRVIVYRPDTTVASMQDEIADGSVERAVNQAVETYRRVDSDGTIEVETYGSDFDDAVKQFATTAATEDKCLAVIVTDLVCNDPEGAVQAVTGLDDDFVVAAIVSNQGYDKAFATRLDDGPGTANKFDVVLNLTDNADAFEEVEAWANA